MGIFSTPCALYSVKHQHELRENYFLCFKVRSEGRIINAHADARELLFVSNVTAWFKPHVLMHTHALLDTPVCLTVSWNALSEGLKLNLARAKNMRLKQNSSKRFLRGESLPNYFKFLMPLHYRVSIWILEHGYCKVSYLDKIKDKIMI